MRRRTTGQEGGIVNLLPGQPIFLTGFMATGKTKVGRILAERLGRPFVDTDDLIVETAGKTIPEIFHQDGETVFRRIEHDCVARASEMGEAVIALGGGAITQEANWETIRQTGICLCFQAAPETIFERVSRNDERPLMAGLNAAGRMDRIRNMLAERRPFYNRSDAFVTSTEDRTPEETADLAIAELRKLTTDNRQPTTDN